MKKAQNENYSVLQDSNEISYGSVSLEDDNKWHAFDDDKLLGKFSSKEEAQKKVMSHALSTFKDDMGWRDNY